MFSLVAWYVKSCERNLGSTSFSSRYIKKIKEFTPISADWVTVMVMSAGEIYGGVGLLVIL